MRPDRRLFAQPGSIEPLEFIDQIMARPVDGEVAIAVGREDGDGNNHVRSIGIEARSRTKPVTRLHPIFRADYSTPGIGWKPILRFRIVDLEPDVVVVMPAQNGITISLLLDQAPAGAHLRSTPSGYGHHGTPASLDVQFVHCREPHHGQVVAVTTTLARRSVAPSASCSRFPSRQSVGSARERCHGFCLTRVCSFRDFPGKSAHVAPRQFVEVFVLHRARFLLRARRSETGQNTTGQQSRGPQKFRRDHRIASANLISSRAPWVTAAHPERKRSARSRPAEKACCHLRRARLCKSLIGTTRLGCFDT